MALFVHSDDMIGNQSLLLGFPSSTPWRPKFFGGVQNRIIGVQIYCWCRESNFYRSGVTAGGRYLHHVELMASKTNSRYQYSKS